MQKYPTNDMVLTRVRTAFAAYRRKHKGSPIRYPANLKDLATASVSNLRRAAVIARTAGISEQALSYWLKCAVERPQELKLVAENISEAMPVAKDTLFARVFLPSGTTIEVPVLALTSSLIAVFQSAVTP